MAAEEFEGPILITADFGHNTLTGCTDHLGDIRISRERPHAVPGREVEEPLALSARAYDCNSIQRHKPRHLRHGGDRRRRLLQPRLADVGARPSIRRSAATQIL